MKRQKFFAMLFMMLAAVVSFSACSSDDDDNNAPTVDKDGNPSIIGTWSFNSDESDSWNSKERKLVENVTFNANGTGTVTGTLTDAGVPVSLNATFDYVLTWKEGTGTLMITNLKGMTGFVNGGTYTLNRYSDGNMLTSTMLRINNVTYKR